MNLVKVLIHILFRYLEDQTEEELEKIEQIVKDNEVRIPYDEDIFIGIGKFKEINGFYFISLFFILKRI